LTAPFLPEIDRARLARLSNRNTRHRLIRGQPKRVSNLSIAKVSIMPMAFLPVARLIPIAALAMAFAPGLAMAQSFELGLSAYNRADFERAFDEWDAIAQFGNPRAQFGLGLLYSLGQGVEEDDVRAMDWFARAARHGHPGAQLFLAHGYETGKGVALDTEQAFHWYLQAAEQGLGKAQNNLGRLFENGVGVTPDIDVAIYWYEEAARNGNANARSNLARLMNSLIEK